MKNFGKTTDIRDIITVGYEADNAVLYSTSQSLTNDQKAQARTNIGAGTSSFDGNYNSLSNKPTIPTKTSQLNNDSNFATTSQVEAKYTKPSGGIPKTDLATAVQNSLTAADNAVKYTSQSLTDAQKDQARKNIGAGTSSFSGSYDDLTHKPDIPDAVSIVQSTGESTSSVMSQKATTDAVNSRLSKTNNTNIEVLGTKKATTTLGGNQLYAPNGIIFGGTAAAAGLVTRGICGITTPSDGGACSKENLYINYDGNNDFNAGRQLVLSAGSVGNHLGSNMYQYTAPRGEIVKNWVEAKGYATSVKVNGNTIASSGGVVDIGTVLTDASKFATSAQGTKADNAMPKSGGTFTGDVIISSGKSLKTDTIKSADGTKWIAEITAAGLEIGGQGVPLRLYSSTRPIHANVNKELAYTSDIPTNYVTTNTDQDIKGKKTVITPPDDDNSTKIANTAWVLRNYNNSDICYRGVDSDVKYTGYYKVAEATLPDWYRVSVARIFVQDFDYVDNGVLNVSAYAGSTKINNVATSLTTAQLGFLEGTNCKGFKGKFFLVVRKQSTTERKPIKVELWYRQTGTRQRISATFLTDIGDSRGGLTASNKWVKLTRTVAQEQSYFDKDVVDLTNGFVPDGKFTTTDIALDGYPVTEIYNDSTNNAQFLSGVLRIENGNIICDSKITSYSAVESNNEVPNFNGILKDDFYTKAPTTTRGAQYLARDRNGAYIGGLRIYHDTNGTIQSQLLCRSQNTDVQNYVYFQAQPDATSNAEKDKFAFIPCTNGNIDLGLPNNKWNNGYITNIKGCKVINDGGDNLTINGTATVATPPDTDDSTQIANTAWVRSHNQAHRGFDGANYYTVDGVKKYYPADNYFLVAYTDHCVNWQHVCAEMDVVDLDTRLAVYKLKVSGLLESATSNNITTYTNKGNIGVTDSFGGRLNTGSTDINNEFFLVCRTTNKGRVRYEIWYNQRYSYNRHKFYFSVDEASARTGITEHFTWNKMRIGNGTDVGYAKAGVTAYMDSKKVNPTYIPTSSWGVDVFKTALSDDESYTNVTIFNNNLYSTTQVGVSTILNTTPYIDAKIKGYSGYKTIPSAQKTAEYRILSEDKGYLGGIRYDRYTDGDSNTRLCTTSTLSGASNSVMLYATKGTASTKNTDSNIWLFAPATNNNINLGDSGNRWLNGYITNLQLCKVINGGGGNSLIQQNSDTAGADITVGSNNCPLKLQGKNARPVYRQEKGSYNNIALQSDIPKLSLSGTTLTITL